MVHFQSDEHQAYFPSVSRDIEVSHWGNVAFRESYMLEHGGARMNSPFNRITFTYYKTPFTPRDRSETTIK